MRVTLNIIGKNRSSSNILKHFFVCLVVASFSLISIFNVQSKVFALHPFLHCNDQHYYLLIFPKTLFVENVTIKVVKLILVRPIDFTTILLLNSC